MEYWQVFTCNDILYMVKLSIQRQSAGVLAAERREVEDYGKLE